MLVALSVVVIVLVSFIIKDWSIMGRQNNIMDNQEHKLQVCNRYIQDLESAIESQDFDVVDVCSTDAYCDYYDIYDRK